MRLLVLVLIFLSTGAVAQTIGTPGTVVTTKGGLQIDSILNIPLRDTTNWMGKWGNLTIRPQDNRLYVRKSNAWSPIPSAGSGSQSAIIWADTLPGRPIATRKNLSDTALELRAAINARFKLSNLVLSLLGYTANDTTVATTGALTEYIQNDIHPYMYYAYDRTIDSIDVYGGSTKYVKLYRHSLPALIDSFQDNNTIYTNGWGLLLVGNQFRVDSTQVATQHDLDSVASFATYTGVVPVVVNPVTHQISLAASGVVPSTYTKVTVNDKGLVTSGAALDPGDIPNIDQSQVNGLVDTITAHRNRIAINRQAIIDTANQLRTFYNVQLAAKEDTANRVQSMLGYTTTDTTYPTTGALAEYIQTTVYPYMYYAYDRAIDQMTVTGDTIKYITLYRQGLPELIDSFVDNNSVFDSTSIYSILDQKLDKADSLTGYATQYDLSLKQDISNITDDALTSPNSTEYPSTKAVVDAIDTALAVVADNYVPLSLVGQANGVAPLDAGNKLPAEYLPERTMIIQGVWDPNTNTPTLSDGIGEAGWIYEASWFGGIDSATIDLGSGNITFYKGDHAMHNGTRWERSVGTNNVISVNGKQGVVLLRIQDIPGLQDSITAKEPVFAKGNLVAGTNVTLGGTLTGRLVGGGNVTINSAVPAGYVQFSDTLTSIATKKNLRDTAAQIRASLSLYELLANKATNFNTINNTLYPSTSAVANKFANGTNIAGQLKFLNNPDQYDLSPANMDWMWHDQFAFGRNLSTWETTTDFGANWTVGTANLGIFNQKQSDPSNTVLLTNTSGSINGLRIKWTGFNFGQLTWIITQLNFTGTTCYFNMLVEESTDNVNFTALATYTGLQQAGATTAAWRTPQATATYTRVTFTINNGLSPAGATASLKNLRGMALRAGDQGGGKEFEYPYAWTNEKYMRFTTPTYTPATGSTPLPAQYKIALLDTTVGKQLYSASLSAVVQGLSLAPTGAAGGDLSGTYPNPTVARFNGQLPAYYLSRANHTGTQAQSTINNLQDSLDSRVRINNGANNMTTNGNTWNIYGINNIGAGVTTTGAGMSFYLKTNSIGFGKLRTDLLTGPDRIYQFPNADGTLALTSQLTGGTVTSVDMSVPTGLTISGSPITTSGTLAVGLQSGYSIPTVADQANWTAAYNDKINSASFTGTGTKTLTLTQQDGGTVTANFNDADTPYTAGTNISITGHVITGTGAPASGSANYIQNQFSGAQTADAWISGNIKASRYIGPNNNFLWPQADHWRLSANDGSPGKFKVGALVVASDYGVEPPSDFGLYVEETAQFGSSVGIGTASPAQALHVIGSIRQTSVTSSLLKTNASGDLIAASAGTDYAAASGSSAYINNETGTPQGAGFWIDQDSKIQGDADQLYNLSIGTSSSGYENGGAIRFLGAGGTEISNILGTYGNGTWNGGDGGKLTFNTYQSGSVIPGMTLNGNNLDVLGNVTARGGGIMIARFLTDQPGRRNWGFSTENSTVGDFSLSVSNANNSLPSISVITALSNGNIGIGEDSPAEKLHVGGNVQIDGNITADNLASGSYTPIITFASGSFTPEGFRYIRVGNIVNVDGRIAATPGVDLIGTISLPVASNIVDAFDITGGAWGTGINAAGNIIRGDTTGDAALLSFNPSAPGSLTLYVHFSYIIQ